MRNIIFFVLIGIFFISSVQIQAAEDILSEQTKGKEILEGLRESQIKCTDLSNNDFELLGEYFMGQMMGISHEAMNQTMEQMMGKEIEEQMHITMGKRLTGCNLNAEWPQGMMNYGVMPMMMQMMMGGYGNNNSLAQGYYGGTQNMMGWGSFGQRYGSTWWWINSLFGVVLLVFLVVAIIALIKWLQTQNKK